MNKFKKPSEYPGVVTRETVAPPPAIHVQEVHQWECVACATPAVILHKGTGYCRPHYAERARVGTLVN